MIELTQADAERFAAVTLANLTRMWPWKPGQVFTGPAALLPPDELHPAFFGSFDWHSCVHGWWQVMQLARRFPAMAEADAIGALADRTFTEANIAGETATFEQPEGALFERPYGWAWLLALQGELERHEAGWARALDPLASLLAGRMTTYLHRSAYPIRSGAHFNSGFAMLLAHHWASGREPSLAEAIEMRAQDWFGEDRDCQAWEPDGDAFLSPALIEAALVARLLAPDGFARWFDAFLPRSAGAEPASLFAPVVPHDRDDGKMVHLDGLNLSRAWCWRLIGDALGDTHPVHGVANEAASAHLAQSLPHLADSYAGSHWLASFALLALGGEV